MIRKIKTLLILGTICFFALTFYAPLNAGNLSDDHNLRQIVIDRMNADRLSSIENPSINGLTPCVSGNAGSYECNNVDLLSNMPLSQLGGGSGADIWGWTDPQTSKEYALFGRTNGISFVEVTDPENPVYLGNLPTETFTSQHWRDIKVYQNHAFVVSDFVGNHGMQVFDLTRLRNITTPDNNLTADTVYHGNNFGSAHNVVINEDSGYAYIVGGNCSGGLHMVNIQNPLNPTFAGCFSADGYTHDAQCVNYAGPDPDHQGDEICFNLNEDTVTIVDVTDKGNPVMLSRLTYAGSQYSHQGWLSEDHTLLFQGDELDESRNGVNTRTRIFDVTDLDSPSLIDYYEGSTTAIDHNLYVHNGLIYEANYRAGLQILDASDAANGNLVEVGFFDTFPNSNSASFNGAWSVYPYFASGTLIVSDIERGLFVLKYNPPTNYNVSLSAGTTKDGLPGTVVSHQFTLSNDGSVADSYDISINGETWQTDLQTPSVVSLNAGQTAQIMVEVTIPIPFMPIVLDSDSFTVSAQSQNDGAVNASSVGETRSVVDVNVQAPTLLSKAGAEGTTVNYQYQLTNAGNYTDTFNLTVGSHIWQTTLAQNSFTLAPSASVTVNVDVLVGAGSSDTVDITAISQLNPAVQAVTQIQTMKFVLYLPIVQN